MELFFCCQPKIMNLFEKESWRLSTTKNEYYHLEYVGILGAELVNLEVFLIQILIRANHCPLKIERILKTKNNILNMSDKLHVIIYLDITYIYINICLLFSQ